MPLAGCKQSSTNHLPSPLYCRFVPTEAGPQETTNGGQSSRMWMYKSNVDPMRDDNSGLLGPLVVTARGMADPVTKRAKDVDRDIVTMFTVSGYASGAVP